MAENRNRIVHINSKLYNTNDIHPIAIWLCNFRHSGEFDDETCIKLYETDACEVYDLAHRVPEWAKNAEKSPFYKYTEGYQRKQEERENDETTVEPSDRRLPSPIALDGTEQDEE